MKIRLLALAALMLATGFAPAAGADEALASTLEKLSQDQIAAFNREDAAATLAYAHTQSPTYADAKKALDATFGEIDAKAEQVSFQYIGHDDEFALARVKVKVVAPGADGFYPNVVDTITLFHQEGGAWKIWDAYLVGETLVK